jgi:outer membrane protein TolC
MVKTIGQGWLVGVVCGAVCQTMAASIHDDRVTSDLAVASCLTQPLTQSLTLAQVLDQVLCSHPQLREAWLLARVQTESVGMAQAAFWPTVTASAEWTRRDSSLGRVSPSLSYPYQQYGIGGQWTWLL